MAERPRRGICRQFERTGTCTYPSCNFTHETPTNTPIPASQRPCLFFLKKGFCRNDSCLYSHDAGAQVPLCRYYTTYGNCRYRSSCLYSHPGEPAEDPDGAPALYREWVKLLGPPYAGVVRPLGKEQMARFLVDADKILGMGTMEMQLVINQLGSENGLRRVRQWVEETFSVLDEGWGMSVKRHGVLFLRVLGHEEMGRSLVLEEAVARIFGATYGPGGGRGVEFFEKVVEKLEEMVGMESREWIEEAVEVAVGALWAVLSMNREEAINLEFNNIVARFMEVLEGPYRRHDDTHYPKNSWTFRSAQLHLDRIKTLLKISNPMPNVTPGQFDSLSTSLSPSLQIDELPGSLSPSGPRHTNDHPNIASITILPSASEIRSNRPSFIPERSHTYPHHPTSISRLLDFHFRLLREDTSGQIRSAVRWVQDHWAEVIQGETPGEDEIWTVIYNNAAVDKVELGLGIKIAFLS